MWWLPPKKDQFQTLSILLCIRKNIRRTWSIILQTDKSDCFSLVATKICMENEFAEILSKFCRIDLIFLQKYSLSLGWSIQRNQRQEILNINNLSSRKIWPWSSGEQLQILKLKIYGDLKPPGKTFNSHQNVLKS